LRQKSDAQGLNQWQAKPVFKNIQSANQKQLNEPTVDLA